MPILPNDTLSSIVNLVNRANSDPVVQPPLSNGAFTLDSSGVAGFFGGESAVRAMGTTYLIPKRRWLGWYNAPGAYEVAKQYSGLAKSHLFNALFPGDDREPAKILMVDNQVGPEYTSLYLPTPKAPEPIGHLGSLIARKVSQMPITEELQFKGKKRTMDVRVTFVKLMRAPSEFEELELSPSSSIIFTVFTILISAGGCIACALVADWFCFASIAVGIAANGVACSVIGSGKLFLKHSPTTPSQADTPGDVLLRTDTEIIVLIGNEGMVRPFTHGRLSLRFGPGQVQSSGDVDDAGADSTTMDHDKSGDHKGDTSKANPLVSVVSWYRRSLRKCLSVDISVILLLFQFLAQLLFIPQGTLFGQLMFIGTLVPSWMYHSYLSTLGLDLQTQALFNMLSIQKNKDIIRYQFQTWTQAAVFACLVSRSIHLPVWHLSNSNANEQSREDALMAEKKKQLEALEVLEQDAKKRQEEYDSAAREAEAAAGEKEKADKEVEETQKEIDQAQTKVEEAEDEVKAMEEAEEEEKENVMAAKANLDMAMHTNNQDAIMKAQEMHDSAEKLVEQMRNKVVKWNKEVKKWEKEVRKKERELKKKKKKATEKAEAKETKDTAVKMAADQKQAVVEDIVLKKGLEDEREATKKQQDDRNAEQKKRENQALTALLDALLPGQTDVWRAFKESLVRKLSKSNTESSWAYMEIARTLEFDRGDEFVSAEQGVMSRMLKEREDLDQLHRYQGDAQKAFTAWKDGHIHKIPPHFRIKY